MFIRAENVVHLALGKEEDLPLTNTPKLNLWDNLCYLLRACILPDFQVAPLLLHCCLLSLYLTVASLPHLEIATYPQKRVPEICQHCKNHDHEEMGKVKGLYSSQDTSTKIYFLSRVFGFKNFHPT